MFTPSYLPYRQTNAFSSIALDYIDGEQILKDFYQHPPSSAGIDAAIKARQAFPTDRGLLADYLTEQYDHIDSSLTQEKIESLRLDNTFTITTAHQPNIFTGHLYFVYKILHAIKLADKLTADYPQYNFVPVYYMGSEDADLEELGQVYINGEHHRWQTNQTGAVGRMKIDNAFIELIALIEGQLAVEPFGAAIMGKVKSAYRIGNTIEQATFEFVHGLFAEYGLVVFLPDHDSPKRAFNQLIRKELETQFSSKAVQETVAALPARYKVQAAGRDINLFYLQEGSRERIEAAGKGWTLPDASKTWTKEELLAELEAQPKNFSANVILRPVFQELVLPNIAFIGGGGELAYWLELKKVFEAAGVPYPVLLLRNSFLLVDTFTGSKIAALGFTPADFFKPINELLAIIIKRHSSIALDLGQQREALGNLYNSIGDLATAADPTLKAHTQALFVAAEKRVRQLEKKMYKAEKKRFEAQQRQLEKIKDKLYPDAVLQERIENLLPWYAKFGPDFIAALYQHSLSLEQEFCIMEEAVSNQLTS
ncbi:MAG: bacillithiol biosynthesis cysteine-adding enzyme BshC [Chitinophagaceae bacterium]|nr:MAG: bacillithiol biosynthesis cysteine-adding enzyme BshC [Chitinophagaceae bacterium]